jgi:diguanylate cyclase (GGDEF)-like protein
MAFRPRTIGSKLLWAIGVPAILTALAGVGFFWREADHAVERATRDEAVALAELISTTFALTDRPRTGGEGLRSAHRSATEAIRADWKMLRYVRDLRILDPSGLVRWSRRVEEEGRPHPDALRLLARGPEQVRSEGMQAEVVMPLGGMACAGCHEQAPMQVGVLQLTIDEPKLRREVASVFGRALSSVVLFGAVLFILTAVSLHFFLQRPLRRLTQMMRRAEEGDFLVRVQATTQDEIGELGQTFNRMLARITDLKADEIETHRDLAAAQAELSLKKQLEEANATLQRRVKEQVLLFDVARSLTSTLELPELFGRISTLVAERLKTPRFSIMLLTADGRLEVKSAYPAGQGTEGLTFTIGEGACGRAAEKLEPIYIADLQRDGGAFSPRKESGEVFGSLVSMPMLHKGALLGVLNFERPEVSAFALDEIELLHAVADLAATAAKNALLHEETVALSITDPLTGAANRRHLFSRLEMEVARALRYGGQVSVLMVDIDHFKMLNDLRGHRAGDVVLRKVCDLMKGAVRKLDTLARYGGEEFMLILPHATKPEAQEVAEKLRRAVEEAPIEEGTSQPTGRITISIGVSNLPGDAKELGKLVDCADAALYASKRGGRNLATSYEPGMELHPGRERGPNAAKRRITGEQPAVVAIKA